LLHDVGQFVSDEGIAQHRAGLVFASAKGDVLADGEGTGVLAAGDVSGVAVIVEADMAEAGVEGGFHARTDAAVQGSAVSQLFLYRLRIIIRPSPTGASFGLNGRIAFC
jgi:hypothetical protein